MISDEEIHHWIKEGWKFTKRTRSGHVYITRRKGANIERSLGRFNQILWDRIVHARDSEKPREDLKPIDAFLDSVDVNRAFLKSSNCLHRDDEKFCTYWKWSDDYFFLKFEVNIKRKKVIESGKPVYLFYADPRYCMRCTAYISSMMKISLFGNSSEV
jgi:hypothetical protein